MAKSPTPVAALEPEMPIEQKPAKSLGPLRMIWRMALSYPREIVFALIALLVTSMSTIAIPMRFKAVVDQAFGPGAKVEAINHAYSNDAPWPTLLRGHALGFAGTLPPLSRALWRHAAGV